MRDLYDSTSRRQAERELADWHRWATLYDVAETNRLAGTLRRWEREILAYFDTGLTNGPTEGTNPHHQTGQTPRIRLHQPPTTTGLRVLYRLRMTHCPPARRTEPRAHETRRADMWRWPS